MLYAAGDSGRVAGEVGPRRQSAGKQKGYAVAAGTWPSGGHAEGCVAPDVITYDAAIHACEKGYAVAAGASPSGCDAEGRLTPAIISDDAANRACEKS